MYCAIGMMIWVEDEFFTPKSPKGDFKIRNEYENLNMIRMCAVVEILRAEWSAAAWVFAECSRAGLVRAKTAAFKISALFALLFGQAKSRKINNRKMLKQIIQFLFNVIRKKTK